MWPLSSSVRHMQTVLSGVFAASAIGTVVALVAAYSSDRRFTGHLRVSHPKVWASVEPPFCAEPSTSSPLARFIWRREYAALGDQVLTRLGERARARAFTAVCLLVATILLGLGDTLLRGG